MKKNITTSITQKYILILLGTITLLCSSSCKTLFTQEMYKRLPESSVKKVQFYVSQEIVLVRELSSGEAAVAKGQIKLQDGKYYEYITIPKGVPGVCVNTYEERGVLAGLAEIFMDISFDNTGRTLKFDNYYDIELPSGMVRANFVDYYYFDLRSVSNEVKFGDKNYRIENGSLSQLMVKGKQKQNVSKTNEVIKGRKLE